MKKFTLLLSALLMVSFSAMAQRKIYLHFNDGTRVEYIVSRLDSITFDSQNQQPDEPVGPKPDPNTPNANGHEYVDLGLPSGTLWATCNVGADSPEDYGDYFAWGETEPKSTYNWSTYKWMTEGMSSWIGVNKYTFADGQTSGVWYNSNGEFIGDNKTILELSDDAVNANWGGDWRMPTKAEQDELRSECTWTWTTKNGVNGYKVTSKTNGNSIFLPAAGDRDDSDLYNAGSYGYYWSSSLYSGGSNYACYLSFNSDGVDWNYFRSRYYGRSVRPVMRVGFTYEATFDSNGGEGTMPSIAIKHAEVFSIPENKFTHPGYEFICWNTKADGTGTNYYEGDMLSIGSNITLYAQWILLSDIPRVENPSEDKTTFLFQIDNASCDNFELYLMGINKVWEDVPEMKFNRVEGTKDWFQLTINALDQSCTNFKIRANGDWNYEPKQGYLFLLGAHKYVKDGADGGNINNLMVIQPTGGKVIVLKVVEFVSPSCATEISAPSGYHSGYGYVDLGLPSGTLWATCNVGATSPEGYGDYFAWGETQPKSTYNWSTYKWMTEGMSSWIGVNKYTFADGQTSGVWYNSNGEFIGDNKTILELSDDAVNANWGGDWRMPTKAEQDELRSECTWTWTTQNGVNGYKVTSKTNGNSIFLPAAGYRDDSDLGDAGSSGLYWGSSLYSSYSDDAYVLYFYSSYVDWDYYNRYYGQSVRAVLRE